METPGRVRYAGLTASGCSRSRKPEGPPAKLAYGSDNADGLLPSVFLSLGGAQGLVVAD
jgi:hypothetical protein